MTSKKVSKLAIVGAEEHTRDNAPWQNDEYHILLVNEHANAEWCKRWDIVLQLHKPKVYMNPINKRDSKHWAWLQEDHGEDKRIFMQYADPQVPNAAKFPLRKINKKFMQNLTYKGLPIDNWDCSISFALAWGAYAGYKQIDLYGVEMEHASSYRTQRANVAFWVGVVSQHTKVDLHCTRDLFDTSIYGYEDVTFRDRIYDLLTGVAQQQARAQKETDMYDASGQTLRKLLEEGPIYEG